jgi:hypothetical protein
VLHKLQILDQQRMGGRELHEGEHVRRIHRQGVQLRALPELPSLFEQRQRLLPRAAGVEQPPPLEQTPEAHYRRLLIELRREPVQQLMPLAKTPCSAAPVSMYHLRTGG